MTRRPLLTILLLAAALRVGLLAGAWNHPDRLVTPDSEQYALLAQSLAEDGTFRRGGQAEIFRTPGYPFFLLVSVPFPQQGLRAACTIQAVLDVLLVYVTFLLGSMLAGRRAGLWAGAFQAVAAVALAASIRLLSDGLYALLFTLAVTLIVHHLKTRARWSLLSSAVVLAAACYVRPVGLVMAGLFAVALLCRPGRWRRAGAFAGIVAAAVAPWIVRNWAVARYAGFSSFAGDALYFYAVPEVTARVEGAEAAAVRERLRRRAEPRRGLDGDLPPPGPAAHRRLRRALAVIADHPGTYATVHLRGTAGVYLPGAPAVLEILGLTRGQRGTSDVLRREGLIAAVRHYFGDNVPAIVLAVPLVLLLLVKYLAAASVLRRVRLRMPAEVYLLVAVVAVTTLLPGPFGLPRYRVPIEPVLSVAAGAAVAAALAAGRSRRAAKRHISGGA
jgi:4-amino-4-deoxy-L-arabinose transferase-like glycosyltransferase